MKTWPLALCLAAVALQPTAASAATPADPGASNTLVRFDIQRGTNALGRLDVELFDHDKPETVRNFLLYVWSGAFSNSFLHRCVPGFVVQGGGFSVTNPLAPGRFSNFVAVADYGRLTNEFLVGPRLSNTFGTLAMAKVGGDPNSATSQWFFNLGNNTTNLDNQNEGFTVFGRVLESTNLSESTNVLAHFNALSNNAGIVNLGGLGAAYSVFSDLPVSYTNSSRPPTNSELYYTRISVLNRTNQPGPAPPTIALVSPPPNSRFTNQIVTLRGTAADDTAVARVVYRLQGGPLEIGAGTTNWEVNVAPQPGFNTVTVESIDCDGLRSTNSVSATFFYVAQVQLDLQVVGNGKVFDVTNGQTLQAGRVYTANARPSRGQIFGGWSGSVISSNATLTFQVPANATNFSLTAKFVQDPFIQLAGTYHGLLRAPSAASLDDSGFVTLALTKRGTFSGKILHRGGRYSHTGRFDRNGSAFLQGTLGGVNRSFNLRLDLTNPAGVIANSFSPPEIQLERVASTLPATNPPPLGRYTLALPTVSSSALGPFAPGGNGFGVAKLARNGTLQISGTLGDGNTFTASPRLSRSRRWPLYVSLDRGRGVLLGWLTVSTNDARNFDGSLQWIRTSNAKAVRYPAGFTNQVNCLASAYEPPASGVRVLNWVHGLSHVSGANLELAVTNLVKLSTANTLAVADANPAALTIGLDLKTGQINGSFAHPWTGTTNALRGVVLKREETIRGQFIDIDETGSLNVSVTPFLLTQSVANVTLDGLQAALVEGGLLRFEQDGVITLTNSLAPAYDTLLDANGHNIVIDGGGVTRLFEVRTNLNFAAVGVTFANGAHFGAAGANGSPPQPGGDGCGAGILNLGGSVSLTNCALTNFLVMGGSAGVDTSTNGAIAEAGRGRGAAVCNLGGRITLQGCVLADNRAVGGSSAGTNSPAAGAWGGAVFSDGFLLARNSTLERNVAEGGSASGSAFGGAVASLGAFTLDASTLSENLAQGSDTLSTDTNAVAPGEGSGGAIYVTGGSLVATNSTLAFNRAAGGSGAAANSPRGDGRGGALTLVSNSAALVNLTLALNRAEAGASGDTNTGGAFGGGLANLGGTLTLRNSIVASNTPASFFGGLTDGGYNLSSDDSFAFTAIGSFPNTNALLGPLTTNGGPTRTMALLSGSPARNAIPTNLFNVPSVDQRGERRPVGPGSDIGAFEFVPTVPEVSISPTNANVRAGNNATFQASADGAAPLSFAWLKDGVLVVNATNTSLVLANVQTSDTGNYAVIVTNSFGAITSAVATLTVDARPLILVQPGDATVSPNGRTNFIVIADGPSLTYAWLHDDALLPGETNNVLTITNAQPGAQGRYQVIVTNSVAAVTSRVATLTFDALALSIIAPPQSVTATEGQSASLTVGVSGIGPFTYQWLFGANVVAETNSLSPTNELLFSSAASTNAGTYRVVVTNAYNALTSAPVQLMVVAPSLAAASSPPMLAFAWQGTNRLITCRATPGHRLRLLRATNLGPDAIWQPLATNLVPVSGTLIWPCPAPPDRALFFRAASP